MLTSALISGSAIASSPSITFPETDEPFVVLNTTGGMMHRHAGVNVKLGVLSIATALALAGCASTGDAESRPTSPTTAPTISATTSETGEQPTRPSSLEWFGFVGVVCGVDDPHDTSSETNYLDEVKEFSNLAHVCVTEVDMLDELQAVQDAGMSALLDVTLVLFEYVPGDAPSGASERLALRSDVDTLWASFIETNKSAFEDGQVAALYVVDEPVWNGATTDDIESAAAIVERDAPTVPAFIVEAPDVLAEAVFPASIDWVGVDLYGTIDPSSDRDYLELMDTLTSKKSTTQSIAVVLDSKWQPVYEQVGIEQVDLAEIAVNYVKLATTYPDVIALIGYSWPGGIDGPDQLGARDLPSTVTDTYRQLGTSLLDR
jgi:hypothetical protein